MSGGGGNGLSMKVPTGRVKKQNWVNVGCYPTGKNNILKAVYIKRHALRKAFRDELTEYYILSEEGTMKLIPKELEFKLLLFENGGG